MRRASQMSALPTRAMPTKTARRAPTIRLLDFPVGERFLLPSSGKEGCLLKPATEYSAFCRIWRTITVESPDGPVEKQVYDDLHIGSSVEVIRLSPDPA